MSKRAKEVVDDAFKQARGQMGSGWNHISEELQHGLVSAILLGYLYRLVGCEEDATPEQQARVAVRVREVMKELGSRRK